MTIIFRCEQVKIRKHTGPGLVWLPNVPVFFYGEKKQRQGTGWMDLLLHNCARGRARAMGQTRAGAHVTLFAGWGERSALLASECAHIAAQQERANPRRKDCADQTPAKRVNMMQYTLI